MDDDKHALITQHVHLKLNKKNKILKSKSTSLQAIKPTVLPNPIIISCNFGSARVNVNGDKVTDKEMNLCVNKQHRLWWPVQYHALMDRYAHHLSIQVSPVNTMNHDV